MKPEVSANLRRGIKKVEKREGGGGGGGTKKKVDKKRVAHNGVVGPSFIFPNLLKNRVFFFFLATRP